jgi:hypothetical protein
MTCNVPDTSLNPLSNMGFRMVIDRLPTVAFWCDNVPLPGLYIPEAKQSTPTQTLYVPGNGLMTELLNISFRVNEDMTNYLEVYRWLIECGFPNDTEEYDPQRRGVLSDMTLLECVFEDAFPVSLGGSELVFSSITQDINYLRATASFRVRIMKPRSV